MIRIVILASGSGSNAENIVSHFVNNNSISVVEILCNKKDAKVFERAKRLNVNCLYFNKKAFTDSDEVLNQLKKNADYIILAGFLLKIPTKIIEAFPNKIINTHPAILPSIYGGKGMYGKFVHEAVIKNGEKKSGVTIHYVNEVYDDGEIILTKELEITLNETVDSLENRIKELEKEAIIEAFEKLLAKS